MQSAIDFERVRRENHWLSGHLLPHLPADFLRRMHGEALEALALLPPPSARHFSCVATDLSQAKPVYTPHGASGSAPIPSLDANSANGTLQLDLNRSQFDSQHCSQQNVRALSNEWQQQHRQQLGPIRIRELSIGRVHVGRVLCARVCTRPIAVNSVQLLLEDCACDAVRTSIYNVPTFLSAGDVLEPGTRLLVREPFYKLSADGLPTLRIDNPTDLVIDHTLEYVRQPQRTLEPQAEGQRGLQAGAFRGGALSLHTGALSHATEELCDRLLQRHKRDAF